MLKIILSLTIRDTLNLFVNLSSLNVNGQYVVVAARTLVSKIPDLDNCSI